MAHTMQIFILLVIGWVACFALGWTIHEDISGLIKVGTRVFSKRYGGGNVIGINSEGNFEVEYDHSHIDLEDKFNNDYRIIRHNCLDWYSPNGIRELGIIKKAA